MRWIRHLELTIEPLIERAGGRTRLCDVTGADFRSICRARVEGLTIDQADRYALAFGQHPMNVWPAWPEILEHDVSLRRAAAERARLMKNSRNRQFWVRRLTRIERASAAAQLGESRSVASTGSSAQSVANHG